jgi:hypothetical protein
LTLVAAAALWLAACTDEDVKTPTGDFTGKRNLVMRVSGRSIELAAFDFPCRGTTGRTSLNGIALEKTSDDLEFSTTVRGIVSYKDGAPDENGVTKISGQFDPDGKSASGTYQVTTKRCGQSREIDWRAR